MKPFKPTRKDLLQELESIYRSLVADGEELVASGALPSLVTETDGTEATAYAVPANNKIANNKISDDKTSNNKISHNKKADALHAGPAGQQSLFVSDQLRTPSLGISSVTAVEPEENTVDESKDETVTVLENPFLPRHVRERLEQERSLYEREIEAASRMQTKYRKSETPYHKYQGLVDDVVAQFMPRIEADLRLRLQKLLIAETDKTEVER